MSMGSLGSRGAAFLKAALACSSAVAGSTAAGGPRAGGPAVGSGGLGQLSNAKSSPADRGRSGVNGCSGGRGAGNNNNNNIGGGGASNNNCQQSNAKRRRGRPPNAVSNGTAQRRGSLHSKNSITTDSPRSESTKNSDSGSATEEETCFTLRLVLPCSSCGESSSAASISSASSLLYPTAATAGLSSSDGSAATQRRRLDVSRSSSQQQQQPQPPSMSAGIVVVCCECRKGFHQSCHLPRIPQVFVDDSTRPWRCRSCVPQGSVRKSAKNFRAITRALYQTTLPYSPSKLGWDPEHTQNSNHRYCYCGRDGFWKEKMLQCRTCLQWFHQECVRCLEWPLLRGDLFYNYRCSICTRGPEYLRRLRLSWVDVTDLLMYQLHLAQPNKEFFQTRSEIFPYLDSIWSLLQVPQELDACSSEERHSHVLYCLRHVRQRFRAVVPSGGEGHGGPAFALIDPQRLPALSAQHWQVIRQSLRYSQPSALDRSGSSSRGARSCRSSQLDDEISLSSTITSSSATSIASKTNFDDLFDSLTKTQQHQQSPPQQPQHQVQSSRAEPEPDDDDSSPRCADEVLGDEDLVGLGGDRGRTHNDDVVAELDGDTTLPEEPAGRNAGRQDIFSAKPSAESDSGCRRRGGRGDEQPGTANDEPIRKKLRPRTAVQEQKKKRKRCEKKSQLAQSQVKKETFDETVEDPIVTASLARIPIPESFSGVNNPFYEDPEGSSCLGSLSILQSELGPRTMVKKRKLQARDLVITKDGKIRCKRLRRRHSAKLALLSASEAAADISESSNSNSASSAPLAGETSTRHVDVDGILLRPLDETVRVAGTASSDEAKESSMGVFAFKSSMEQSRQVTASCERSLRVLSEIGSRGIMGDPVEDPNREHCRRVVAFQGETSLIRMAFGDAALASRKLRDGSMEILLKR